MNTRPTRTAPPPSDQHHHAGGQRVAELEAEFTEAQPVTAQLPARTEPHQMSTAQTVSERAEEPEEVLPATGPGAVITAIAAIMFDLKPIEKTGWNDFHKYWHVRMQDLSRELTPLMGKHGIVIFQTEDGRELFDNGNAVAVRYRFTVVHKSGEIWPQRPLQTGVSACRHKGGFDDKALNKCHTAARKYFLLSLFQLPSEDSEDADTDGPAEGGNQRQRPQGRRRPVPSPSGKLPPHILPVIEGENPAAWVKRFGAFIDKAENVPEIDAWYDANIAVFDKLKNASGEAYNSALDRMDERTAFITARSNEKPAAEPAKETGTFPADRDPLEIPPELDRRVKKPAADKISERDRDWLTSLEDAFKQCTDFASLSEEQRSLMLPSKDHVGGLAWNEAVDILNTHIERVNG